MILQALKGYYDRLSADPDSEIPRIGWEYKEIPFVIVLNPDGALLAIEDTREGEGKSGEHARSLFPKQKRKQLTSPLIYCGIRQPTCLGSTRRASQRGRDNSAMHFASVWCNSWGNSMWSEA